MSRGKGLRWAVGVLVGVSLGLGGVGCGGRTLTTGVQDQALVPGPPPPGAKTEEAALPPPPMPTEAAKAEPAPSGPESPPAGQMPGEETQVTEPPVPPPSRAPVPEEPPPPVVAAPAPPEAGPPAAAPESVSPPVAAPAPLEDVFFDFDQFTLRSEARSTLEARARVLKGRDGWTLLIEGHCDERGTADYNLVLGERRAQAVKRYLTELGVPAGPLQTTSFGKERPFCTDHSEGCWQTNRRAHLRQQ